MRNDLTQMRASDTDRQQVVDRLRTGLEDGRLTMEEYVARMDRAYQAVTYGDLAPLHADLPAASPVTERQAAAKAQATTQAPAKAQRGLIAGLPTTLKVFWTIWLTAVSINVVVWALVSATHGELAYPWPLWVAGPFGALLAAISVGVTQIRGCAAHRTAH